MSKTPRTSKKSTSTKRKKTSKTKKKTSVRKPRVKKEPVSHWENTPENIDPFEGFVYEIENLVTGKLYIGRKYFWSTTRTKVKGKKRRKVVRKESNWRSYTGSCIELNADIKLLGKENFRFTILSLHETKGKTNYAEVKEHFVQDVLHSMYEGEYLYYNTCILNRYYRGRI